MQVLVCVGITSRVRELGWPSGTTGYPGSGSEMSGLMQEPRRADQPGPYTPSFRNQRPYLATPHLRLNVALRGDVAHPGSHGPRCRSSSRTSRSFTPPPARRTSAAPRGACRRPPAASPAPCRPPAPSRGAAARRAAPRSGAGLGSS